MLINIYELWTIEAIIEKAKLLEIDQREKEYQDGFNDGENYQKGMRK